ncbi:questin oxidase family protein [Saccharospirillum salsuginis]|uniref:Questin oxidase family protein n=1 Tax=Saccharospirillum salsuginis TaxID=418750 RepID=A0A918K104_9GAMM|nr:questin oxidase family protein [Saccharospirillum salsuginis]GGX40456.1 hypothetical protein GCM10007392_03980 [Saccharospirillum salsuginis]
MTTLQTLLAEGRQYAPTFRNGLANHLPMALIALDRLGATDDRLEGYYQHYRTRLEPFSALDPDIWPEWSLALGRAEAFPRFLAHFEAILARDGRDRVLRDALPHLMPGVCASAFHALIRLAYGIRQGDEAEIAHALAYWAADWQDLGPVQTPSDRTPDQLLTERSAPFADYRFGAGIIVDRMHEVSRHPDFVLGLQQPNRLDWDDLVRLARRAFRDSGNFTILHGLTSLHAMWIIRPWLEQDDVALRYYWLAYLVAFISTRKPAPRPEPEAQPTIDPNQARDWAMTRDDDHDIKLVYTCLDFHENADEAQKPYWLATIERRIADQTADGTRI